MIKSCVTESTGLILKSASHLRNVYCLNLTFLCSFRSFLVKKMISPVIFDPDHSFKQ